MSMIRSPRLRPLSTAVQHLLKALECIHIELSIPQPPEHFAELTESANQLRAQICTLVNLLKPAPIDSDFGGSLGGGFMPVGIGGRGRPQ